MDTQLYMWLAKMDTTRSNTACIYTCMHDTCTSFYNCLYTYMYMYVSVRHDVCNTYTLHDRLFAYLKVQDYLSCVEVHIIICKGFDNC